MDESLKAQRRELKRNAVDRIQRIDFSPYRLERVDPRLLEYCIGVRNNPELHNLYEILAVLRFFSLLDKYDFDEHAARRFIRFAESVKLSGTKGRRSYPCTPVQVFEFASIWGFRKDGKRLVREACFFIPRKYSKTTTAAIFATYDMMYGDYNAQAYVGANSYDQAQQCFKEIRGICQGIDPKMRFFHTNRHTCTFKRNGRDSLAQCLSSDASTKDGLNASLVIMDEYSQAKDSSLFSVLTTSQGVREEPMTLIITTASDKLFSPFTSLLDGYRKILEGAIEGDEVFAHIFEPDIDDAEDEESTWRKVQPHFGITVREDFYINEYRRAIRDAEAMLAFRTKLLNVFAESATKEWITHEMATSMMTEGRLEDLRGKPACMVAIDLSVHDDFSAVAYCVYDRRRKAFHTYVDYYFPEGALDNHPNRELYEVWANQGYLKLCDGDVIDYAMIVNDILNANKYVQILNIGYDAYKSLTCVNMLRGAVGVHRADKILRAVPQTYGHFTSPVDNFEYGARTGSEFLNNNPINAYCFANAVIDIDRMENKKPIKRNALLKIDGVIVVLMCHWLYLNYEN